jgi:hypothetical protein
MSLNVCNRCGSQEPKAVTCPNCGANQALRRFFNYIVAGLIALVIPFLLTNWTLNVIIEGDFWGRFALAWIICWAMIFAFVGLVIASSFADGGLSLKQCLAMYPAFFLTVFALLTLLYLLLSWFINSIFIIFA